MADNQTAEVLEQDGPTQDHAEESSAVTQKVDAELDPQATAPEADDEIEEKVGKRLGGWQRKIKRLEQTLQEQSSVIEQLRGGSNAAKPENAQATEDKPPVKPTRPKETDFDDWGKFRAAEVKYLDDFEKYLEDKDAYRDRQREVARKQQFERETIASTWAERVAEAKKEIPDFEEYAFSDAPMTQAMQQAIIDSELGAQVAYYLGKNPEEAERISKLSPVAAIREIGKLESRIAGKKSAADDEKDEPAASTRAPKPPTPVRQTRTTNPTELSDDLPYKEWKRRREAQLRSK